MNSDARASKTRDSKLSGNIEGIYDEKQQQKKKALVNQMELERNEEMREKNANKYKQFESGNTANTEGAHQLKKEKCTLELKNRIQ